jgi:hypothetical protein
MRSSKIYCEWSNPRTGIMFAYFEDLDDMFNKMKTLANDIEVLKIEYVKN